MNTEQKKQIRSLRKEGYGYTSIAHVLGLTKSQVSAYCRRNDLSGRLADLNDGNTPGETYCLCCGKKLTQIPGRKEIKFCSDACRLRWWNSHPDDINRKAFYTFTCACCGKTFTAYGNRHRKYCSHACYIQDRFKGGDRHE
ncbi:MAG: RNA polymerase subunit sigma-70 [Anaerovoracaceae bacterium]